MNRKHIALIILFLIALSLTADEIQIGSYEYIIRAIESYLNNDVVQCTNPLYLFVCNRSSKYHNGYEPTENGINLSTHPYLRIKRKDVPTTASAVNIAIDYTMMNVIIDMRINGKAYEFLCNLVKGKRGYRLINVPKILREND